MRTYEENYDDLIDRRIRQYGDKFSDIGLNKDFIPYFESGSRVEVSFCDKDGVEYERKRGTIGVTTGWVPVFILMLTRRSTGSVWTIGENDKVVRVIR